MALIVIATGGNSLIDPELPPTVANQIAVTERAVKPIADLVERGEKLIITHGNGPQVGFMALRSELSRHELHEVPLDALVADTQGSLGYMIQRALREELRKRGIDKQVVSVVTEIEVDPHDHAFEEPTKPIGRFYTEQEAELAAKERGWIMKDDARRGWRRVVPSPAPVRILQLDTIRLLAESGVIVVCCGGGGIPVVRRDDGDLHGIEGVIDKDRASSLLAVRLDAERLIITTGVDTVYKDFLTDHPTPIPRAVSSELVALLREGQFPQGSMRPKVKAALTFLKHKPDGQVTICRPEALVEAFEGRAGTHITET